MVVTRAINRAQLVKPIRVAWEVILRGLNQTMARAALMKLRKRCRTKTAALLKTTAKVVQGQGKWKPWP